jgi:ABC-2 type transport system ATP-binding protein
VSGTVHVSHDGRRLRAPVRSESGLATTVVRALDAAGVSVDDVEVHQPSLDDVFFSLTGHPSVDPDDGPDEGSSAPELEVARS